MPEQLTKHPEVTLQVLRSAGARCSEGAPQDILVECPAARFCKLPGGEICVYGLPEASRMTQISPSDWQAIQAGPKPDAQPFHAVPLGTMLLAVAFALAAGVVLTVGVGHLRRRRQLRRAGRP